MDLLGEGLVWGKGSGKILHNVNPENASSNAISVLQVFPVLHEGLIFFDQLSDGGFTANCTRGLPPFL